MMLAFAVLNRARGSQLFGFTTSTTEGRLVSTGLMSMVLLVNGAYHGETVDAALFFPLYWALLMFWCVFAWDKYWIAAIGNGIDTARTGFAPVDWLMSLLPVKGRLWGVIAMGLRQLLLVPAIICAALISEHLGQGFALSAAPLLFGVPYLLAGYLVPNAKSVMVAEITVGSLMGAVFALIQSNI